MKQRESQQLGAGPALFPRPPQPRACVDTFCLSVMTDEIKRGKMMVIQILQ